MKFLKFSVFFIFLLICSMYTYLYAYDIKNCNTLYNYGQYQKASTCFYSLMVNDKKNLAYKLGYGNSLFSQKRYNEAKIQYNEIIQINPSSKEAAVARKKLTITNNILKTIKSSGQNDLGNYVKSINTSRWASMPVKVWIEPSEHYASVMRAFNEWQDKTKGLVSFSYVSKQSEAKITVHFKTNLQSTPNGDALGNTTLAINDNIISYAVVDIKTTTQKGVKQTNSEIYSVALHEVGHALGIRGHSNNKYDVMYPNDTNYRNILSNRDINTVKSIYGK